MQDVAAGRGAGVLDPHGELFDHLLSRLARLAERQPALLDRIVIIDPLDPNWTVGFNPLDKIEGISPERLAAYLSDVVVKITQLESSGRTYRLLNFTFAALAELGSTLINLPRFLVDESWRAQQLVRVHQPDVLQYFHYEFPKTRGGMHEWVTPILNRVGQLLFDPDLRLMFSMPSTISFRQILDRGLILLVNLSKGQLGEANSALLGGFIVAHIQKAALARTTAITPASFFLYLDEFQNYTTDNVKDVLSESRKYGLSLVLAHQFLDQLAPDLLGAVLNTTKTLACFRVGYGDATLLAHELFAPGLFVKREPVLEFVPFGPLPIPWLTSVEAPVAQSEVVSLLTHLENRVFWIKVRGPYLPAKQRTLEMPVEPMSAELHAARKALISAAGQRYARLKSEVRHCTSYKPVEWHDDITYYEEIPASEVSASQ